MKMLFKTGDVVKFKDSYPSDNVRGMRARVLSIKDWGVQVEVIDKRSPHVGEISTESFTSLELVYMNHDGHMFETALKDGNFGALMISDGTVVIDSTFDRDNVYEMRELANQLNEIADFWERKVK